MRGNVEQRARLVRVGIEQPARQLEVVLVDVSLLRERWVEKVRERVKAVVLFGDLAELLEEHLRTAEISAESDAVPVVRKETLAEAVAAAAGFAKPGDVVLLSPGGTSYDAFSDFEERGRFFRALVKSV
jgi:UDP-N-acetylmuramoylalanine--D-glutamate ligase